MRVGQPASAPPLDAALVEQLYPNLPQEPPERPQLPDQGHGFRLQKICQLQKRLEGERDNRPALYKKYRRAVNATDGADMALATASMGTGTAGIVLLSTVLAAPIVVALEVTALGCGLLGVGCKFVSRKLASKAKKHDEIRVLAESKLNTIVDIVSHSLQDNDISDTEFRLVLDEVAKYSDMKKEIRLKAHHAHAAVKFDEEEKKHLIAQGREEARTDLVKAMAGHSH